MVSESGLSERTVFMGYLSPEETREEMARADIYVCTSNKLEGWGSVIYEGLAAGCAVIATSKAGATPFLIEDGRTGYVFRSGDAGSLSKKLTACLKDAKGAERMGQRAYEQMQELWNPKTAASRLITVSDRLLAGRSYFFDEGPLSRAEIIYENWYDRRG